MIPVHLSVAVSIDGYLNDRSENRLILSSAEDLADVQRERANYEAILVGAETVRTDNPLLVLRDEGLMAERVRKGMPEQLTKVTITATGELDAGARFFTEGNGRKLVLCPAQISSSVKRKLGNVATIIGVDDVVTALAVTSALEAAGLRSLFVEGGVRTLSMFLAEGMFDTFRLAIAPVLVADEAAPHLRPLFGVAGTVRKLAVSNVRLLGDTTVIDYTAASLRRAVATTA